MISNSFIRGMGSISLFPETEDRDLRPSFISSDAEAFQKDLQQVGSDMWTVINTIENQHSQKS
jgi:hypothetical protein